MTKKSSLKETPNLLITIIVAILLGGCGVTENILATQTPTYTPIPSVTGTIAGIKDSPTPPNTTTTSSEFIGEHYDSIHKAAEYGDVEAVKWYLENGVSINSKDPDYGGAPLHWAASFGHTEVVKLLIQEGADLTLKDSNGATPLHIAADSGQLQVCSILVEENENTLYEADNNGAMPIHMAAVSGHMPIIQYFLEQGMDINARDKGNGQGTPLHWAASNGQTSTISQLLQNGADPTIIDNYGDTAQDVAAKQNHEMAVDVLANWTGIATPAPTKTDVTVQATERTSPLPLALEMGERQNKVDSPPLIWASEQIATVLGTPAPQEGYWHPSLIVLEVLTSDAEFDPSQYDHSFSYNVEFSAYQDGDIITGVAFSNPEGVATFNVENQYPHPLGITVQTNPTVELFVVPLIAKPPATITDLPPGFHAVRMSVLKNQGLVSNWVYFEIATQ